MGESEIWDLRNLLKALGNSIVPQVAIRIFEAIKYVAQ